MPSAAVHHHRLPCHVPGVIGSQKGHHVGDVVGHAQRRQQGLQLHDVAHELRRILQVGLAQNDAPRNHVAAEPHLIKSAWRVDSTLIPDEEVPLVQEGVQTWRRREVDPALAPHLRTEPNGSARRKPSLAR